jgi:hypothetical protein
MRLRSDGLSARELDGRLIVLDIEESRYLTLSVSGTMLFRQLENGAEFDSLTDALVAEYDIDVEQAAADVRLFLDELREAKLLIPDPG